MKRRRLLGMVFLGVLLAGAMSRPCFAPGERTAALPDPQWQERAYSWTATVPPEFEDASQAQQDAWAGGLLEFLVGTAVTESIALVIKYLTTALIGFISSFTLTFLTIIPTVGCPGHTDIALMANGEAGGNAVVNHPYIALCMVHPGDEFFVPKHLVVARQTGWFSWETVATPVVLTASVALEIGGVMRTTYVVPKQPLRFTETGTYRISYGDPDAWWDNRVEEVVFNVVADTVPPYVRGHRTDVKRDASIYVAFSEDMNASTLSDSTVQVTGSSSGRHSCSFGFSHTTYELTVDPNSPFSYGERVTVALTSGARDLAGNGLLPYSFEFAIEADPGPVHTSIAVGQNLSPSTCNPYDSVRVYGDAQYNNGDPVSNATVKIRYLWSGAWYQWTASTNASGSYSRYIVAPGSAGTFTVYVEASDGKLTGTSSRSLRVQTGSSGSNYRFVECFTHRDRDSDGWPTGITPFFRADDEKVLTFVYLEDVYKYGKTPITVKWEYYQPDGQLFQYPLTYQIPDPGSGYYWGWYGVYYGWYLAGYSIADIEGRWTCKIKINEGSGYKFCGSCDFTIRYEFDEHRMCKDVQSSSPWGPIGETNIFSPSDTRAITWMRLNNVVDGVEVKWEWYEPSGAKYTDFTHTVSDPGVDYYYPIKRVWGWIWISGYRPEYKCGNWSVKVYIKDAFGQWDHEYTDHFRIEEKTPPDVSVSAAPSAPIETQEIALAVSASDNNHLQKVVLHWDDGSAHSRTWDNIDASSFSRAHSIGSAYTGDQQIEYWAEAWDESGNRKESGRQGITVQPETVSTPNRPHGDLFRKANENGSYGTSGSSTNLGHDVEYQFEWADGSQSTWSDAPQTHAWPSEGVYHVKARARCKVHTNRTSTWSTGLPVTVESTAPVVNITTNGGADFETDQAQVTVEGTCSDPAPSSGLAAVQISTGDANEGTPEAWRFTVDLVDGVNPLEVTATDNAGNSGSDSIAVAYHVVSITGGPSGSPNPVASGGAVQCTVTAADSMSHALGYLWTAPAGSFDDPTEREPVWTAPTNASGQDQGHPIGVTVTCTAGKAVNRDFTVVIRPNVPPSAPKVDVIPDNPKTNENLECLITTGSTDPDPNDTIAYSYRWYKDNVHQSAYDDQTSVSASETAKGEEWKCQVIPNDGTEDGSAGEDSETIRNTAPSAPTVDVIPDNPETNDSLECVITTGSTDPDPNDTITYSYRWYKDGVHQSAHDDQTSLSASETAKGEEWKCQVIPNDGTEDGSAGEDAETIGNTAPSAPNKPTISPSSPLTDNDLILAEGTGSADPDTGDAITYEYEWSKDDWVRPGIGGRTLPSSNTTKGDTWKGRTRAYDGTDYSNWVESDPVAIGNTAPSAPDKPTISPTSPLTGDDLILAEGTGSTDPDTGDTITYEYEWSKDDWATPGIGGRTLPSSNTTKGDTWKGRTRAYDGMDYSNWVESDPVTIENSVPALQWLGQQPYLADAHAPEEGTPNSTQFTFKAMFQDADGTPPRRLMVFVQRVEDCRKWRTVRRLRLRRISGSWESGMVCGSQPTELPNGAYRYRLWAIDDEAATATGEPTRWHRGPRIVATPQLWCSGFPGRESDFLHPETGVAGETRFKFTVLYSDGEGDRPVPRRIEIQRQRPDGQWAPFCSQVMTAWGGDPRSGKCYSYQRKFREGEYRHRFVFEDVNGPATGAESRGADATQWQDGPIVTESATDVATGAAGLPLTSLLAAPSATGVQISFVLGSTSAVDVRVLNIAGRPVRTVCRAKEFEAGRNEVLWNAQSDNGLRAPNGTYLVETVAKSGHGEQTRALAAVRLTR